MELFAMFLITLSLFFGNAAFIFFDGETRTVLSEERRCCYIQTRIFLRCSSNNINVKKKIQPLFEYKTAIVCIGETSCVVLQKLCTNEFANCKLKCYCVYIPFERNIKQRIVLCAFFIS